MYFVQDEPPEMACGTANADEKKVSSIRKFPAA